MRNLHFSIIERDQTRTPVAFDVEEILLAGYTGRDRAKVLEHIRELEALGVAPPERIPMVYSVQPELATFEPVLEVDNLQTSGETEIFLVPAADGLLIGTGSDHTDREQEAVDVAYSKGLCAKVLSAEVWRYEDVQGHFDQLELRSWLTDDAGRRLYQEGRLDSFISVEDVLAEVEKAGHRLANRLIFCGTLPAIGGLGFGSRFEGQLHDPVLERELGYSYEIRGGRP